MDKIRFKLMNLFYMLVQVVIINMNKMENMLVILDQMIIIYYNQSKTIKLITRKMMTATLFYSNH